MRSSSFLLLGQISTKSSSLNYHCVHCIKVSSQLHFNDGWITDKNFSGKMEYKERNKERKRNDRASLVTIKLAVFKRSLETYLFTSYWDGRLCPGLIPGPRHSFRYVTKKPPKANSAFHLSEVGKWVPASAGKGKAGMVHFVADKRGVCR